MRTYILISAILIILFAVSTSERITGKNIPGELADAPSRYHDGTFSGKSKAKYTSEPFWGYIEVSLENDSFKSIQFTIRDSVNHEAVDSMYGVYHYSNSKYYMQQCVDDGNGIKIYPQKLLKSQDLDKVDAISGATWSYNIFKASALEALKKAKIITGIEENQKIGEINLLAFPNPFDSTLKLTYSLKKKCHVDLSLLDNQGKIIKQLVDQEQLAGSYSFDWNDCPSDGIYFYRLKLDDKEYTGKLVKLKK